MKPIFLIPVALLLAACSTPEERCSKAAWSEFRDTKKSLARANANVARGYAVHKQVIERDYQTVCYDKDKKPYECIRTDYQTVETPVAINIAEEKRKAARLKAKLPSLSKQAKKRELQCLAQI